MEVRMKGALVGVSLMLAVFAGGCGGVQYEAAGAQDVASSEAALGGFYCGVCPYGYVPSYPACLNGCGSCYGGGFNGYYCVYVGPGARIYANPQTVSVPTGGLGSTQVCWDTWFLNNPVYIRVRVNGGPGQLFDKESNNKTGSCETASWIVAGHVYDFTVHTSNSDTAPAMDTVRVTGVAPAPTCALSFSKNVVPSGDSVQFTLTSQGNIPADTLSYLYGTKNGVTDENGNLSAPVSFNYTITNSPGLAGSYVRWMVLRRPDGTVVCQTNSTSTVFQ